MLRHQKSQHGHLMNEKKMHEEETEMSDEDTSYEENASQNSFDSNISDHGTENEDEGEEVEESDSDSSASGENEVNIWGILREKAISQLHGETDIDKEDVLNVISDWLPQGSTLPLWSKGIRVMVPVT